MKVKLKVRIKGFTNLHSGYCSGAECELEEIDDEHVFDADVEEKDMDQLKIEMFGEQIDAIMDTYEMDDRDLSYYCTNSAEAKRLRISRHDVALNAFDLEVIEGARKPD